MFPSPTEVDRFLYDETRDKGAENITFPSPLEVNRVSYMNQLKFVIVALIAFPSPFEVNKFFY